MLSRIIVLIYIPPTVALLLAQSYHHFKNPLRQPWWTSGLALHLAQGVILEAQDRVPGQAPHIEPASPSACLCLSLSLCVFLMNK